MRRDILELSDWSHQLANVAMFGTTRRGAALALHDVWLAHCGFPAPELNTAFLKDPARHLDRAIDAAERYFAGVDLPFSFYCRSDREALCTEGLVSAGYERAGEIPVMVLDPIFPERHAAPRPVGLEVRAVESAEDLDDFSQTAFKGFGLPEQGAHLFLTEQLRALPNTRLYLGRLAGEPVCTSAVIANGPVAGIYWVATLEAHRGAGLGEAVTWAAVRGGIQFGCQIANLQASAMGAPVYARMGFQTPVHYVRFQQA